MEYYAAPGAHRPESGTETSAEDALLVSTTTGAAVFYPQRARQRKLGEKPRNAACGACFAGADVPGATGAAPAVFAARPGARVWVADPESGQVVATINFQKNMGPPAPLLGGSTTAASTTDANDDGDTDAAAAAAAAPSSCEFSGLLRLRRSFLLAWGPASLVVLDPTAPKVHAWHAPPALPVDAVAADASSGSVYVLCGRGHTVFSAVFLSPVESIGALVDVGAIAIAAARLARLAPTVPPAVLHEHVSAAHLQALHDAARSAGAGAGGGGVATAQTHSPPLVAVSMSMPRTNPFASSEAAKPSRRAPPVVVNQQPDDSD
jgi:hypothetical protein